MLDRALSLDPEFVEAFHRRGLYSFARREFADARRFLARAAQLDPSSPGLLGDAAMAAYAAGGFAECDQLASASLRLDPGNAKSHYLLGLALLQLGNPSRAEPHLIKAEETYPRATEILNRLGQAREGSAALK